MTHPWRARGHLTNGQNAALVIAAFLEADCQVPDYSREIRSICGDVTADGDTDRNKHQIDSHEDCEVLESDGHLPGSIRASLEDIHPHVELPWLAGGRAEEAVDYQAIARELMVIAAQFEPNLVAQAAQNLRTKISNSPSNKWKDYLENEVNQLLRRGAPLEHLSQERVIVALTLTLLKGVLKGVRIQAPELIRSLFTTVHQFVCGAGHR